MCSLGEKTLSEELPCSVHSGNKQPFNRQSSREATDFLNPNRRIALAYSLLTSNWPPSAWLSLQAPSENSGFKGLLIVSLRHIVWLYMMGAYQNDFEERSLVHFHEVGIPGLDLILRLSGLATGGFAVL